jgi:hypothetical protein
VATKKYPGTLFDALQGCLNKKSVVGKAADQRVGVDHDLPTHLLHRRLRASRELCGLLFFRFESYRSCHPKPSIPIVELGKRLVRHNEELMPMALVHYD